VNAAAKVTKTINNLVLI